MVLKSQNLYIPLQLSPVFSYRNNNNKFKQSLIKMFAFCHDHATRRLKDAHKSTLYMMEGDCGPDAGMNWTLIGIILGSVVGAVVIIAVVGILISRRSSYNR